MASDTLAAIAYLRTPQAIRERCENVFAAGRAGGLAHFAIELGALPAVADEVARVTRERYPTLAIPVPGRIPHFRAGGIDRVRVLEQTLGALPPDARARAWIDLIFVSVLLDAGAGDAWRYREPKTKLELARSEGLAVASLHAFEAGLFSADPLQPYRVDAAALLALDERALAGALQATAKNPLAGMAGRFALMRALGEAIDAAPQIFCGSRPGGLVDCLRGACDATRLLGMLLEGLAPIWPQRESLGGVNLGDIWRHPAAGGDGPSAGLVPFHKLTQWLAYSLFEPLAMAGVDVGQPDALTGLAEYRNGGLLVDLGVLVPRHPDILTAAFAPSHEVIVEWRALTVALLDRLAPLVRERLGLPELPLANILEGGTWAAGRVVAKRLRPDTGGPPIRIASDGTVF